MLGSMSLFIVLWFGQNTSYLMKWQERTTRFVPSLRISVYGSLISVFVSLRESKRTLLFRNRTTEVIF